MKDLQPFIDETERMLDFIHQSPSTFHVIKNAAAMLEAAGFQRLCLKERWDIAEGGKYYTTRGGTSLVAFAIGHDLPDTGYRIIATHSDTPTFRIKPKPEMNVDGKLVKLNVETYGGAILHTWMDRPLSAAGRAIVASEDPMRPTKVLVDLKRPIAVIPSLAIHMDRRVNEQMALNKQDDMPPLAQAVDSSMPDMITIRQLIADEIGRKPNEILDFDLHLYDTERGTVLGTNRSLVLSPKLDDLSMVYAATAAMTDAACAPTSKILCIFDNEEVGSGTKQGACSPMFKNILTRVAEKLGHTHEDFQRTVYNSFLVSADLAHAVHPNKLSKHDPAIHPTVNRGPVIKINANQKYMTDADSSGTFMQMCHAAGVPYQFFANRSDMPGGSTLGNLMTSQLDLHGVDVGSAIIGMHSARETGGTKDALFHRRIFGFFLGHTKQRRAKSNIMPNRITQR